jgi:hypothetical protein
VIPDDTRDFSILASGEMVRIERQRAREEQLMDELGRLRSREDSGLRAAHLRQAARQRLWTGVRRWWSAFMRDELPRLRRAGWQIEFADDFRHRLLEVEAWDADLVESENGWFDLDMGIIVEGERLPLAPLLAALFRRDGRWLDPRLLAQIADAEMIELVTPDQPAHACPGLALETAGGDADRSLRRFSRRHSLRLSRFDAPRLAELNDSSRWQFRGQSDVLALAEQLTAAQGISAHRSAGRTGTGIAPLPDRRAWPGCSSCAPRTSPAFLPTTWGSARPRRRWRTCCSKRRPGGSIARP